MKLEFGRKLEHLLRERGRNIVPFDETDVVLSFDYSIESEMEPYTTYVYDLGTQKTQKSGSSGSDGGFLDGVAKGLEQSIGKTRPQQALPKINNRFLKLVAIDPQGL